jgi:hypothetical protein
MFIKLYKLKYTDFYLQYLSNEGSVGEAEELPAHLLGVRHTCGLPGHSDSEIQSFADY